MLEKLDFPIPSQYQKSLDKTSRKNRNFKEIGNAYLNSLKPIAAQFQFQIFNPS
jgi:hypothetical protein